MEVLHNPNKTTVFNLASLSASFLFCGFHNFSFKTFDRCGIKNTQADHIEYYNLSRMLTTGNLPC